MSKVCFCLSKRKKIASFFHCLLKDFSILVVILTGEVPARRECPEASARADLSPRGEYTLSSTCGP